MGDEDLRADDVAAGDDFRDGVFDLDPRVDLDEVELLGIGVVQELDGAGVVDADGAADGERGIEDALPHVVREVRRGGEFDDLLVPPLDRAVALEQVDEAAVLVAEELHLDVLGAGDELFEEGVRVAERLARLALGGFERVLQLVRGVDDTHAAAAAAHRRLHDDRVAELLGERCRFLDGRHRPVGAGEDRHVGVLGDPAGGDLVAELFEDLRPRADEDDPRFGAGGGELRVLAEEAVAGVDAVGPDLLRHVDDAGDVEVGADRLARPCRRGTPRPP